MVTCCYMERLNLGNKKPAEEVFSEGLLVTAICLQGDQLVLVCLAFVWHWPVFSTEGQSPGNTGCFVSMHLEHLARFLSREGKACMLSCPILCNPMDCSPPGSSVHGILQARILEWVAISFSWGSEQFRDRTHISCVSCVAGEFFTT